MAVQPAILGLARLGNFHLGDIDPAVAALRRTSVRITLGGVEARTRVRHNSVTVHDGLNDTPNTAALTFEGTPPADVADLRISIGTDAPRLLFDGTLQTTDTIYEGLPSQLAYPCTAIDNTARANRRRPFGKWLNVSATTIANYLVATFAPGFTSYHVEAGLPNISVTFDGSEGFSGCLRQIAKLIGGYFYFENLDLHLFRQELADAPDPIDATHPFLDDPRIRVSRDFSQLRTRVYGRGLGATLLSDIAAGDTLVPIEDTASFNPAGGKAIAESQILAYTGTQLGGAGSAVGPGAAPANAPVVAAASGAGLENGVHQWAASFVTASGESLAGPVAVLTSGLHAAPTSAPTVGAPTIGTGPDVGAHSYAVSFVTASGETVPGPPVVRLTGETATPASAPVPNTPTVGTGPEDGYHDYAASFVTAIGETIPGPISAAIQTAPLAPPTGAPTLDPSTIGSGPEAGTHLYATTFVNAAGETTPGPTVSKGTTSLPAPTAAPTAAASTFGTGASGGVNREYAVTFVNATGETTEGPRLTKAIEYTPPPSDYPAVYAVSDSSRGLGSMLPGRSYRYKISFVTAAGETLMSSASSALVVTVAYPPAPYLAQPVRIDFPSTMDPNATGFYLYRTLDGGTGTYYRVGRQYGPGGDYLFAPNETFFDVGNDTQVSANPLQPSVNTAELRTVHLTGVPIGPAGVTSRRIYRTALGSSQLFLLDTISNNTATTLTDATTDYTLSFGALVPTTTTAYMLVNHLTGIPIGPATTTSRKLYRTVAGGSQLKFLATISGNTTTTFLDNDLDAALGANAPTVNTAAINVVPLTGIPTGDSNVSARKIYRRSAGAGFKLLTTIANNSTTTFNDTVLNASLGAAPPTVSTAYLQRMALSAIPTGDSLVTARKLYRTAAGGSQLKLLATLADNTTTTFADTVTDASLGANALTTTTATVNQAALTSIPLGTAAVTSRKLYRTVAGGSQLKLLATIANNTTTTYTDSTADASLGANAPTSDISGLTQPTGQVLAGSTTLPLASAGAPFAATGGWVRLGAQTVRYTGISGNSLTGIPGPGLPGSLVNTVRYGEHADAAPVLMGVTGLTQPAIKGITVSIWVQRDDDAAQAAMIALDLAQGRVTDGVYEYRISDERRGEASLIALCDADLAMFSRPIVTVVYATRDLKTKAGKPIVINLTSPPIHETLTIQDVTVSEIDLAPNLMPKFTVTASSVRYSLEDMLRQLAATAGV